MTQLTKPEASRLKKLEKNIAKGVAAYVEAGEAFKAIRDEKLYKSQGTFEEYCKARWNLSKSQVYRVIEASDFAKTLPEPPANERQARRLLRESDSEDDQKTSPMGDEMEQESEDGEPTTPDDVETSDEWEEVEVVLDAVGQEVPEHLEAVFAESEEYERRARSLNELKKWINAAGETVAGSYLSAQGLARDVANVQVALRQRRPYAVCPYCQAGKKKCTACEGRGFVPKITYSSAPSELRL